MSIAENVAIGRSVEQVFYLFNEDFTQKHWERLRDVLLQRHPLPPTPGKQEMDYKSAIAFGHTLMNFGKYNGTAIREVPIGYLDWLCREQEDFYGQLRAYLRSEVGKARFDGEATPAERSDG